MAFWGAVVKPGKPHAFVPPPEEWNLHLSQAALAPTVPDGQRVALAVTSDPKDEPVILCTLTAGRTDTAALDLFFSQYSEFSVIGEHELHLSGYYSPSQMVDDEGDEGEEEEDEDYEPAGALGFPLHQGLGDPDDEDDEDEDEDEDDDDLEGLDEDEDEDEDDEDGLMDVDGDDEMFGYEAMLRAKRKPQVVIEDITDKGNEEPAKEGKKAGKKAKASNGATVAAKDEEESEDAEEDEEDEDEEDEEEEAPAAKGGNKKAPAGSKRPAEAKPAANGAAAKKQAVGQDQPVAKGKEQQPKADAKAEMKPQQKQHEQKPKQQEQKQKQEAKQEAKAGKKNIRRHPNGFEVEDVTYGNPHGKLAKPGHKVFVRYTGRLKSNGKVFDKTAGKPFAFRLGVGEVIKGWDLGVEGMRVGDKRRLVIPPQLGYGAAGVKGTIPSNATLEFDVELVDVK